jgi:hypothetical protein
MNKDNTLIGTTELLDIGGRKDVPAKIDTGADSSAIWASNIRVGKDNILRFSLFGEGSPFYNGKIFKRSDFEVAAVRSSKGEEQIHYRARFTIKLAGRKIRVLFNLYDRSRNNFPVLIGRRTLQGRFIIDPKKSAMRFPKTKTSKLMKELEEDPYQFHKKYIKDPKEGDKKS